MATFKEIQDRVLDYAKRPGLTDLTEVKSLINQVYYELNAITRPTLLDSVELLVSGDGTYSIVSDWGITDSVGLRAMSVTDSATGQVELLRQVTVTELLMMRNVTSTGSFTMVYAEDGLDTVHIYPAPSTATVSLTVTYVKRPVALSADADVPAGVPVEFHDVIVLGATARALRVWSPERARDYHADYRQGVMEIRQWKNRQGGTLRPRAMIVGSRSNRPFHDNSYDYSGMR